jgi:predicted RNA-binding protein with PUA-like domain
MGGRTLDRVPDRELRRARPDAVARGRRRALDCDSKNRGTRLRPRMASKRAHWLMKSEPEVYSIEDLRRDGQTHWEGVRNYQARNHQRAMRVGDLVLFYHSNAKPPGVAGVARVCREAYPDDSQFDAKSHYYDAESRRDDPRWSRVDVEFVEALPEFVPLDVLKADESLEGMLVRKAGMRLSVQPVDARHFARVLKLGKSKLKP